MKTQVEKLEHSRVALEIEVEPTRVEEALERAYRKIVRRVNIPGFRRGKAPRPVVEARLGRGVLLQEALEDLVPEVYREALNQNQLTPVGDPTFDLLEAEDGKPLRIKAEVDVKPEVKLGEYKNLTVEKVIERIDDADVEEVLKTYQERYTKLVSAEREQAENGDIVVIDYEGFVEGRPFPGGAAKGQHVELGAGRTLPGFEDQLVGMKKGETRDVKVTFPDDYREDLRGKEGVFKVTLREIKVKQVPEIDDELAKEAGEFDTLEAWKQDIRRRLEEGAQSEATNRMRADLVRQVTEAAEVPLPASLVEAEINRALDEVSLRMALRGLSFQDYLRQSGRSVEAVREDLRPQAEDRVRAALVLDAIAEREGITVDEAEIDAELESLYQGDPQRLQQAKASPAQRERAAEIIRTRKAVDFLVEHAQVTERWVDSLEHEGTDASGFTEYDIPVSPPAEGASTGDDGESPAAGAAGEGESAVETGEGASEAMRKEAGRPETSESGA